MEELLEENGQGLKQVDGSVMDDLEEIINKTPDLIRSEQPKSAMGPSPGPQPIIMKSSINSQAPRRPNDEDDDIADPEEILDEESERKSSPDVVPSNDGQINSSAILAPPVAAGVQLDLKAPEEPPKQEVASSPQSNGPQKLERIDIEVD